MQRAQGQFERERILARYLDPFGLPGRELASLAEALATASPALIRQLCEGIKRNIVIGPKVGWAMQRDAVIERVLAAVAPHPDLGKPRLWSLGTGDTAVRSMPWPLPSAAEARAMTPDVAASTSSAGEVVALQSWGSRR